MDASAKLHKAETVKGKIDVEKTMSTFWKDFEKKHAEEYDGSTPFDADKLAQQISTARADLIVFENVEPANSEENKK